MSLLLQVLLGVLILLLAFHPSNTSEPYSWASNVCSTNRYRTTRTSYLTSRVAYRHYNTKCGWWGWGRCKKSRSYWTYYYATRTTSVRTTHYYCCSGWRQSGRYCSIPICYSGCVHGRCTSPNRCSCNSGYYGSSCRYDRNECSSGNGGCQQVCTNTQGSYRCGCYRGYQKSSSKSCRDFDECKKSPCRCASGSTACGASCVNTPGSFRCNCGKGFKLVSSGSTICTDLNECSGNVCPQECVNTIGSYRCYCRQGYRPRKNGTICDDIDECKTNNGNCEQICNNIPGSRQCACKEGYQLERNGITCTDINECSKDNPCQQNCTNLIGSFTCFCRKGYQLNPDNRTCSDINECQSRNIDGLVNAKYSLSKCEQTCTNTKGSYTCGCKMGYKLHNDGRSCKDVDECTMGTHQCNQKCINTRGSYRCTCFPGYGLDKDGRSCSALPCPILVQQSHGTMTCTGMATNDNCSFTCNHGYDREGPSTITCMASSSWSDSQATCKAKKCDILKPTVNVILTLPCFRTYGSSCNMRCASGHYHTGSSRITCGLTADKSGVTWKNDFQCHPVKSCKPNPCRHGGTCIPLASKDFKCGCTDTGYEGRICEQGVIDMPLFPKLKANLKTPSVSFQAKPSKEIQISIQSDDGVIAEPPRIKLFKSSNKAGVTLESKKAGLKVISYFVEGESAKEYTNPADSILFVSPENPNKNNIFTQLPLLPNELPMGCYMKNTDMFKCPAQLSSTLPWKQNPKTTQLSTKGLVNVITKKGTAIPLSLIGIDFPETSLDGLLDRVKQISRLNRSVRLKSPNSRYVCKTTTMEVSQLMDIVEYEVFTKSFLNVFSQSTPPWLQILNKEDSGSFDIKDIHASVASKSKSCSSIFKSSSAITYEPSIGSTIAIGEDITLPDERGFCYAIDVCTSDMGFSLPSGSTKAIKSTALFQDMKNAGWDIDLTGAMVPGNGRATVALGSSLWNGKHMENFQAEEYKVVLKGKMKTKLKNKQDDRISLDYQGDVYIDTTNITEVFHYGFTRNITAIFKGKAALNMTITAFNKQVNIQLPEKEIVGKSIFGGSTTKQRISFKWRKVSHLLQGTPLTSMVRPTTNQAVFVSLEHKIFGGNQTEIVNINEYNVKLKLLRFLIPKLKSILKHPQLNGIAKNESIKRWNNFMDEIGILVGDIRSLTGHGRLQAKHNFKFSLLISRLREKLRQVKFLCQVIESTAKIKIPTKGMLFAAEVKQTLVNLPNIPNAAFKRSAVSNSFQGLKMLFQGKICSQQICFNRMNITLESSHVKRDQTRAESQYQGNSSVIIQGKATESIQLGRFMSVKRGEKVWLKIPKTASTVSFHFNPTIHLMGLKKVVSGEMRQDTLSFNTSGLLYGKHEASMNFSAKTDVHDWSLLQYRVTGKLDKNSPLPQQLQRKINNHIQDLSQKANKRIQNAENVASEAKQIYNSFKETLPERIKALEMLQDEMIRLKNTLKKAKKDYEFAKNGIESNYSEESKSHPTCELKQCEWECSRTQVCSYESEKLKIPETQVNYEEKLVPIELERLVTKTETAYYSKPTYYRVDTVNCGTRNYELITALVGGVLGTVFIPVPVVGTIVGAAYGWSVGRALSEFAEGMFGCDKTSEVVRGPDAYIPYQKVWTEREKYIVYETRFVPSKPTVVVKDTNSFKAPRRTCKTDTCIKVMNAGCIKENNECYNLKMLYRLNNTKSQYEIQKANDFQELNAVSNKMDLASINLYKVKAKRDGMLEEIKLAKAQLKHLELARNRTEAAITDVKAFPSTKLGLRLSRLLQKTVNGRIVYVSDLAFDFTFMEQPPKKELPLSITLRTVDGKEKDLSVLFDFDKEEISLHKIVKNVIKDLYEDERSARRKRSIPDEVFDKVNKSVSQEDGLKLLKDLDLCLEAKKANEFFKEIVKSLEDLIHSRAQVELSNRKGVEKLTSVYQNFENISANENRNRNDTAISQEIARSYLDYLSSIIQDKQNLTSMSWNETLVSWKAFLEVLTKEQSFPNCAGAKDCISDLGEDLDGLYLYESDLTRANDIRMILSNVTVRLLDLISQNYTVEEFQYNIGDLYYLLNHTEDTNVLCGRKPEITFSSDVQEPVLESSTFTLYCNATSDTEVTYQWIHNNQSVIQSENGSLTIERANTSHAGSYKCKAINRKGFAVSNVTIITINSKPRITEHPNDTRAFTEDGKGLLLICNATGNPAPHTEWFFISQYPNSSTIKIYNDNGSFLYYDQPTKNDSGYYFCIASNKHGQSESRKARVWILDTSPGEPRLGARINVTKTCKSRRNPYGCGGVDARRDLNQIKEALRVSLNNTASKITDVTLVSDGLHNATVCFLYISNKPSKNDTNEHVSDSVIETFAEKRRTLVNSLRTLHQEIKNDSAIVSRSDEEIVGDADSITAWVMLPGCPGGQKPHSNGYMCYNCPPGTYGNADGQCIPCPIKTYQYEQGQTRCIPCSYGYTTKKTGALTPDECFDMRPSPPRNLQATAKGSTRLLVNWLPPKENSKSILSYMIRYKDVARSRFKTVRVPQNQTIRSLTRLKKFTDYDIAVYAVNRFGMRNSQIIAKTGEDVPDAAPGIVQCVPVSYNSIKIMWNPIPVQQRNGIIRGYNIYYRDVMEYQWNVYTTPTGNLTSTIVPGLKSYTEYCVKISAFTTRGEYPDWKRQPCKKLKTPSRPVEVSGRALSPTEILLKFRKSGRSSESNSFVIQYGKQKDRLSSTTSCNSSSCVITNLQEDTVYFFKVLEDVVQAGESAAILQIRTKKRRSYSVMIFTGYYGANSPVDIRFVGDRGTTGSHRLVPPGNTFMKYSKKMFRGLNDHDVGKLTAVEVYLHPGSSSRWSLEKVLVISNGIYTFPNDLIEIKPGKWTPIRGSCLSGTEMGPGGCVDIDECKSNPCKGPLAKCINSIRSYRCECPRGYQVRNGTVCEDINECLRWHECEHDCINTQGSYKCGCQAGFRLVGGTKCVGS